MTRPLLVLLACCGLAFVSAAAWSRACSISKSTVVTTTARLSAEARSNSIPRPGVKAGQFRAAKPVPTVASTDYPPGSYTQHYVPRSSAGMRCPDGSFLPPLNGVTSSDPIPAIQRESFMPAIGEISGKYTDATGVAWWVTSDGSCFTTRWVSQRMPDGRIQRMVRLDQSDALSADFASALK